MGTAAIRMACALALACVACSGIRERPEQSSRLPDAAAPVPPGPSESCGTLHANGLPPPVCAGHTRFERDGPELQASAFSRSIVLTDLNGDGLLDVAAGGYADDEVVVWLNLGARAFSAPARLTGGSSPVSIAAGDWDGNGWCDLAVADQYQTVTVLHNRGGGELGSQATYDDKTGPSQLAAADLNNDGYDDFATANYGSNTVAVFMSRGDGTFEPARYYAVGDQALALALGDLNQDGWADIAVTIGNKRLVMLRNDTAGGFSPSGSHPTGNAATSVCIADMNNDGSNDLVVANYHDGEVGVLLNQGGTFQAQQTFYSGGNPFAIEVADLNGDGRRDVVATVETALSVLRSAADDTFVLQQPVPFPAGVIMPAIGDLDGDGRLDVAVIGGGTTASVITILWNRCEP
jgi:hypothetical protein